MHRALRLVATAQALSGEPATGLFTFVTVGDWGGIPDIHANATGPTSAKEKTMAPAEKTATIKRNYLATRKTIAKSLSNINARHTTGTRPTSIASMRPPAANIRPPTKWNTRRQSQASDAIGTGSATSIRVS